MELGNIAALFSNGGTVVLAVLCVWLIIQDKIKNSKMLEDNTSMLKALTESNNNIAKALDIISNNLLTLDDKADRNYEAIKDVERGADK